MIFNNTPGTSYIKWKGLTIIRTINGVETVYPIYDNSTNKKYAYWDLSNPYILSVSDEWIDSSETRKMIYINNFGEATVVPQSEGFEIIYNDIGNGALTKLTGEALGKFDELDGKFMTVTQDVNSLKEVIGDYKVSETNDTIINRVVSVEKKAEGIKETVSNVETNYNDDKVMNELKDNINISLIELNTLLSKYENEVSNASKDLKISDSELEAINGKKTLFLSQIEELKKYHDSLIEKLTKTGNNAQTIENLNQSRSNLINSTTNLNNTINTALSDMTVSPSELTLMLNMFANVSVKINEYKNTVSQAILLGVGGKLVDKLLDIDKTASEFNQTMSTVVEEIDGETGLKKKIQDNSTAIKQTSENIELNYTKFDKKTASLLVGDGEIKLDASKTILTGSLTWDSLDDVAKENLKGKDGLAEYVILTGENIIKYNSSNVPENSYVTIKMSTYGISQISNIVWKYKTSNLSDWTNIDSLNNINTFDLRHDNSIWGNSKKITIRAIVNDKFYDDFTVAKLYDGLKGEGASYVKIQSEQLFKYELGADNVLSPINESIVLKASKFNIVSNSPKWYYKTSNLNDWELISDANGFEYILPHDSILFGNNNSISIKFELNTYSDIVTIGKIYDGENGTDGSDGYFVLLTNENCSLPCDSNGDYEQSALSDIFTEIRTYKGLEEINPIVTYQCFGCTATYNKTEKKLYVSSVVTVSAKIDISIQIENKTFVKTMTITKTLQGKTGNDGAGINVIGELPSIENLPSTGKPGDAYIINGLLFVWSSNTNAWSDGVPFEGKQGIPGQDGIDGKTTYLHIKYSNDGTTFTENQGTTPGKWIGQYTDFYEEHSLVFSDYTWKKIVGEDGDNGIAINLSNDSHTIPTLSDGTNGNYEGCSSKISLFYGTTELISGITYGYTASAGIIGNWNSSNGTFTVTKLDDFIDSGYVDLKANYNNIMYTKRFTISKNKQGLDGEDSYTINIDNDNHSFIADSNGKILTSQSTEVNVTIYKGVNLISSRISNVSTSSGLTSNIEGNKLTVIALTGTNMSMNGTVDITIEADEKQFIKKFTYTKVNCGEDGTDGYTVFLTNENNSFICENSGTIKEAQTVVSKVEVYAGTSVKDFTFGLVTAPKGLSITLNKPNITISTIVDTTEVPSLADNGTVNIPIIVDGITFIKTFSWTKSFKGIDGSNGADAKYVTVNGERTFKYSENYSGTPTPSKIVLTASKFNISSVGKWQYKLESGTYADLGVSALSIDIMPNTGGLSSNKYCTFRYIVENYYDEITIAKIADGSSGKDAYTVLLSNENHSFVCESNGTIGGNTEVSISVLSYKGKDSIGFTFGAITKPNGMNIETINNSLKITALNGSNLASSGTVNIPIIVDGITFIKTFSWTKSFKGIDGGNLDIPSWIKDWEGATTINGSKILTPKLFAGTVTNNLPTGVAMGKGVISSVDNGIVGYKNGEKTYILDVDGSALFGKSKTTGNRIYWDGSNLDIVASSMSIVGKNVATEEKAKELADNSINELQISDRNLVLNSDLYITSGSNTTSMSMADDFISLWNKNIGSTIIISVEITATNALGITGTDSKRFGFEVSTVLEDNTNMYLGVWQILSSASSVNTTSTRISNIFKIPNKRIKSISRAGIYVQGLASGSVKVGRPQILISDKDFDWSKAPEDIDNKIDNIQIGGVNLQRNANFTKGFDWWANGTAYTIDTSKQYKGCNSVKYTRSGLTSNNVSYFYSGSNKIPAYPNETYTASCKFYTDNVDGIDSPIRLSIFFYNSTGGTIASSGNIITLSNGSWIDATKTFKAPDNTAYVAFVISSEKNGIFWMAQPQIEKGNKATDWALATEDVVGSIEIGGTNLINESGNFGNSLSGKYWVDNGGGLIIDTNVLYNGYNTIKTSCGMGIKYDQWVKLENNVEYTYSMMVKCNETFSGGQTTPLHFWAGKDNVSEGKITIVNRDTEYPTPNVWKKIFITFKLTHDGDSFKPIIYFGTTVTKTFNIANIQVEKGNKATDWSMSTEDSKNMIDNIQVGGTNLLLNTGFKTLDNWRPNNSTLSIHPTTASPTGYCIKCVATQSPQGFYQYYTPRDIGEYTISFWGRADSTLPFYFCQEPSERKNITLTTTWQKFTHTFRRDTLDKGAYVFYPLAGGTFYIHSLKVEKGNKATDWNYAPEDTIAFANDLFGSLENQIDGKIQTYYQTIDPSTSWTTTEEKNKHAGDIWYNSNANTSHRWTGSTWIKLNDQTALDAEKLASTKAQIYTTTPVPPYYIGDLWITNLTGSGVVKTCKVSRVSGSYVSSDWVEGLKYIDSSTAGSIAQDKVNKQTQNDIFNKLTNNGADDGIYIENGKIYIKGSVIKGDTIAGQYIDARNLAVYRASDGKKTFGVNESGEVFIGGNGSININNVFTVDSNGALVSTSANIKGTITGSTISGGKVIGASIEGGTLKIGSLSNGTVTAYSVSSNGTTQIGGLSAVTYDGARRAICEITNAGAIYSCDPSNKDIFTRIRNGAMMIHTSDSQYINIDSVGIRVWDTSSGFATTYGDAYIGHNTSILVDAPGLNVNGWVNATKYEGQNHTILRASSEKAVYLCCNGGDYGDNEDTIGVRSIMFFKNSGNDYVFRSRSKTGSCYLGTSTYSWGQVCGREFKNTSDRTLKENISYLSNSVTYNVNRMGISVDDLYEFVKNDLPLAVYNYIEGKDEKIGFIAQDIIYNEDQTDNVVGQLIVNPKKYEEENAKLTYDLNNYTSVLAGALQKTISIQDNEIQEKELMKKEIEILKKEIKILKGE